MKYIYTDIEYDGEFPAASVGLIKGRRFRSTNFAKYKCELGVVGSIRYVVFDSPSKSLRSPIERVSNDQIPRLPGARIGEETNTYAIDDTPFNFIVEDGVIIELPNNRIKAFCLG